VKAGSVFPFTTGLGAVYHGSHIAGIRKAGKAFGALLGIESDECPLIN